ncbi:MAG: DNA ligase [Planctomycetes bacterium]|nr:DNA ligase [Planctomycetota bacterium]
MPDLDDGESMEMQGSGAKPYVLKNTGGVYSCTCPAWRNQSVAIERRTCKHLRKLRGDKAEEARTGGAIPEKTRTKEDKASNEPPLLLAQSWDFMSDPTGWWLSEKLDGVRAYWDGRQFLSRLGNVFYAPDWFIEGLPAEPLDGELWLGRKSFQRAVSIVRRQDKSDHWKELSYVVFDAPSLEKPFEARSAFIEECLGTIGVPHIRAHTQEQCKGIDHLKQELARLEALGGEGLMLRKPGSKYESGRSMTLLKVKNFHDAEARVLKHLEGAGRHKGRLGALQVELPDGTTFSVGTGFSDKEREAPPPVGSTITFRYQELSDAGVPRFPSFVGVRAEAAPIGQASGTATEARGKIKPEASAEKAAKPKVASSPGTAPADVRRFEFVDGKSEKFWEIGRTGCDVTVRFGRIGANGQTQTKSFSDEAAAVAHVNKLVEEKTEKGYKEVR